MNEYYKDFRALGYSKIEAQDLTILAAKCHAELPCVSPEEATTNILEAFDAIGCTSFLLSADEIGRLISKAAYRIN